MCGMSVRHKKKGELNTSRPPSVPPFPSLCKSVTCTWETTNTRNGGLLMEKWGLLVISVVFFLSFLVFIIVTSSSSFYVYVRYLVAVLLVRAQYFIQIVGRQLVIRVAPARGRSAFSRQLF